jgi:hypothetical protein
MLGNLRLDRRRDDIFVGIGHLNNLFQIAGRDRVDPAYGITKIKSYERPASPDKKGSPERPAAVLLGRVLTSR